MFRFGVVIYDQAQMLEQYVDGNANHNFSPLYLNYEGKRGTNPMITFCRTEADAQNAAQQYAKQFPGKQATVFTISDIFVAAPSEPKQMRVTEKGILPA